MRQLVFLDKHRLEWREAPDPVLRGDGEALVRPICVATCDLDRAIVAGRLPAAEPFPFGHEGVAEVIAVGDAVTAVSVGQTVSVPFQISCGTCAACRRGHTGHCERVERMAMYGLPIGVNYGGFLADTVRVPFADAMLVAVPDGVPPAAVAGLSDNLVDAWRTVGPPLRERPGAAVLVVAGATSIAVYAADIALALGAARVDLVGGDAHTRATAEALGATLLAEDYPHRAGSYPITVDACADPAGLHCALRSTAPEGLCTSVGIYFAETTPMPLLEMYSKGIRFVTGRVHARPAMDPVLDLVRSGLLHPEAVVGETADWDDAPEAVAEHRTKLLIKRR
jgi:alcohol dehydrogenase